MAEFYVLDRFTQEPPGDDRHCEPEAPADDACGVETAPMADPGGYVCTIRKTVPHTVHEAMATGGTIAAFFWEV